MNIQVLTTGSVWVKLSQLLPRGRFLMPQLLKLARDRRWSPPLPINTYLIEHPEGFILVDTGDIGGEMAAGFSRVIARKTVRPDEEIGAQLAARGLRPSDLRVVLTHLHADHTGGLGQVQGAEVLISTLEYQSAFTPLGRVSGTPGQLPPGFKPTLLEYSPSSLPHFPQARALTAARDVWLVPTPGHSDGHASVLVNQSDHWVMIAGDASYTQAQMLEGRIDGVSSQPALARQSLERIRAFCRDHRVVYLPSHDPESARRLEQLEFVPR